VERVRRTWSAFKFRKAAAFAIAALALTGGYGFIRWYATYDSDYAEAQLEAAANAGRVHGPWSDYDLICFNIYPGSEAEHFGNAARAAGKDIQASLNAGGEEGSCRSLYLESDKPGVIGFVRGSSVRCTVVNFGYDFGEGLSVCMPPQRISVTKRPFSADTRLNGRPWPGVPSESYYSIREIER